MGAEGKIRQDLIPWISPSAHLPLQPFGFPSFSQRLEFDDHNHYSYNASIDPLATMEVRRAISAHTPPGLTLLQGILDFSKEFDVSLMDRVVMAFYSGAGQEVRPTAIERAPSVSSAARAIATTCPATFDPVPRQP